MSDTVPAQNAVKGISFHAIDFTGCSTGKCLCNNYLLLFFLYLRVYLSWVATPHEPPEKMTSSKMQLIGRFIDKI